MLAYNIRIVIPYQTTNFILQRWFGAQLPNSIPTPNISGYLLVTLKKAIVTSICLRACFLCTSVSAWMRSASPSTSVRSSFPLKKALFVKSPGSACLQPGTLPRALRTARTTAGPPWVWNSTESSPVKLWGPVKCWKVEAMQRRLGRRGVVVIVN